MTLRGILSAVATPFAAQAGEVDDKALRALVERTIRAGVHGLVACGSTGEFTRLSTAERHHVAETVIDQAAGRVTTVPDAHRLDRYERDVLAFVIAWAPYGGPPDDEVLPEFGITKPDLITRAADIVRGHLAVRLHPGDCVLLQQAWTVLRSMNALNLPKQPHGQRPT